MTKIVEYTVIGSAIADDIHWRMQFICGHDKEYSVISKNNGQQGHYSKLKIRVSNDSVPLFKRRYPRCKVFEL